MVTTALVVTDVNDYSSAFRYDYDFFLGPVNAMRHGHPLLVDTFSQYGVGLFYALTGAFHAIPLSYGGLQFVLCIAYAAEFALVYSVLRLACRSQLVAVLGLAAALVASLAVSPQYIAAPSVGPLRFGLPWVVILAGTLRARSFDHRRLLDAVMLVTVGAAAVWSAETFVYSFAAYAAITVFSIVDRPESPSERSLRVAKRIAAAVVVAFLAVGATSAFLLVVAGDWPRWTDYLGLVALYAMRGFGSLLIPPWSPGYLVGALYVVSLTALVALPRDMRRRLDPTIAATAGATAFGAIAFTYFLGRSAPSNLNHIAVPAVVVACGWWTVVAPHLRRLRRAYAWGAVLAASCVGASVLASSTNVMAAWLEATPLVQVVRSPGTAASRISTLLTATEDAPRIVEGARLVRTYSTTDRQPAVLISADYLTTVLLAAHRGNALPIVNGNQEGLVDDTALKRVVAATDRLPRGIIRRHGNHVHAPAGPGIRQARSRSATPGSATISCRDPTRPLPSDSSSASQSAAGSDSSFSNSGGAGDDSRPPSHGRADTARELEGRPSVRAGDTPHRPRAVHAGGRRPHRLGALRGGHRRRALRRRPRDRRPARPRP